jgi:hypothetical protein
MGGLQLRPDEKKFMMHVDGIMNYAAKVCIRRGVQVALITVVNEEGTDDEKLARWLQKVSGNRIVLDQFNETTEGSSHIFRHIHNVVARISDAVKISSDNYRKLVRAKTKELEVADAGSYLSGYLQRMRENGENASVRAAPKSVDQVWPAILSLTAIAARLVEK